MAEVGLGEAEGDIVDLTEPFNTRRFQHLNVGEVQDVGLKGFSTREVRFRFQQKRLGFSTLRSFRLGFKGNSGSKDQQKHKGRSYLEKCARTALIGISCGMF